MSNGISDVALRDAFAWFHRLGWELQVERLMDHWSLLALPIGSVERPLAVQCEDIEDGIAALQRKVRR